MIQFNTHAHSFAHDARFQIQEIPSWDLLESFRKKRSTVLCDAVKCNYLQDTVKFCTLALENIIERIPVWIFIE